MARSTHAAQIDLRLGDLAGELLHFRVGIGAGDFAAPAPRRLPTIPIGMDRQAQRVAKGVSGRVGATL